MDTLARLKTVPLFASLAPDALAQVAELATRRLYPKGSLLCQEGDSAETLFVIDSGEAVLRQTDLRGVERPVGYLREGGAVGEDALFLADAYGVCVQATTDVEALQMRKADLDRLLERAPHIREQLALTPLAGERLDAPQFPWLGENERALLLRRRHWIIFLRSLIIPFVVALLLLAFEGLLRRAGVKVNAALGLVVVRALPTLLVIWIFVDWRNDFFLVTTDRVVHREKLILMHESQEEAPLSKIQDTRIVYDFIGKLLGYGSLRVDTASARGSIIFDHVSDPDGMQEVIFRQLRSQHWKLQRQEQAEIRRQLLAQTGRAPEDVDLPPPQEVRRTTKPGILGRLAPSRPLFQLHYQQADRLVWRKHWVFLLGRIWLPLLASAALASIAAVSALGRWPMGYVGSAFLVSVVLCTASTAWLWWEIEDWRNDEYIVTDRMLIDVQKKPLFFSEERKQAALDKVENVSLSIRGPFASLFGFGDVLIQTAGAAGFLAFRGVPHPSHVQSEIFRRMEAYREAHRQRERLQKKAELSAWFKVYDEINRQDAPNTSDQPPRVSD